MEPTLNTENIKRLIAKFESLPDSSVDMTFWLASQTDLNQRSTMRETLGSCGTTACMAGWAVALFDPDEIHLSSAHGARLHDSILIHNEVFSIEERAMYLLGLSESEANVLFHRSEWPLWAKQIFYEEGDRRAIIAILRRILKDGIRRVVMFDLLEEY